MRWVIPDGVQPASVSVTITDKAGAEVVPPASMTLHERTGYWWYLWDTTAATPKGSYVARMLALKDGHRGGKDVVFSLT